MGTMKVLAPVVDTVKRPHMLLMMYTLVLFELTRQFPSIRPWVFGFSVLIALGCLHFVGRNCTDAVRWFERVNVLFLAILFYEVASI